MSLSSLKMFVSSGALFCPGPRFIASCYLLVRPALPLKIDDMMGKSFPNLACMRSAKVRSSGSFYFFASSNLKGAWAAVAFFFYGAFLAVGSFSFLAGPAFAPFFAGAFRLPPFLPALPSFFTPPSLTLSLSSLAQTSFSSITKASKSSFQS